MPAFLSFMRGFGWKLCIALIVVAVGDYLFFQRNLSGGYLGIFAFVLLLALLNGRPAIWRDRRALAAALAAAIFASALVFDPGLLSWSLFCIAISMATLLPVTGRFDDGWRWFQRLVLHGLRSIVAPLIDMGKLLRARRSRHAVRPGLRQLAPVLALPLLGSAVIIGLFAAANPVIGNLLSAIGMPDLSMLSIGRMILWTLLFILVWSILRPRLARGLLPTFDGSGDLPLPGVSVASVRLSLILFNLLFAIQNMLDVGYLWGIAPLPDGMTLAQYAHRGAYPLIATALLAGLFVLVTLRPGSTTAAVPAIRRLLVLWIAQNILLVASSILRTLDYIDAFSLTRLRVAALAWMVLVAIGLLLICWRMLRGRSAGWLINSNLAAAGAMLTAACFVDSGSVAAYWNVRHAREVGGTGAALDLCYLDGLDGAALLPLIELEGRRLPPAFRVRVQVVRARMMDRLTHWNANGEWTWRNADRLDRAKRLLAHRKSVPIEKGDRTCNGALVPPPPAPPAPPPPQAAAAQVRTTIPPQRWPNDPRADRGDALTAGQQR